LAVDAQPEMQTLACKMKQALDCSIPKKIASQDWHLPFITNYELTKHTPDYLAYISAMRCARISYLNHDATSPNVEKDYLGGVTLRNDGHCFIGGTKVLTIEGFMNFKDVTDETLIANIDMNTLEFVSWEKPIRIIARPIGEDKVYYYPSIDLGVTEHHTMIGSVVSVISDRTKYTNSAYKPSDLNSKYCKFKTKGESRAMLPKKCNFEPNFNLDYIEGQFIGFYIGDGFKLGGTHCIRLVKNRKIVYLKKLFSQLQIEFSEKERGVTSAGNVIHEFKFNYKFDLSDVCGNNAMNKKIPDFVLHNLDMLAGIFDGLKNSDGSLTKNTWNYSTVSPILQYQIVSYSKLVGLSIISNKARCIKGVETYRLRCDTFKYHTVNSGKKDDSVVIKNIPSESIVYCVEVPNHAIIIETESGRSVISGNCSPLEHQATPMDLNIGGFVKGQTHMDRNGDMWSGNFKGWNQFRHLLD
jgi:hypothetical protein